MKAETAIHAIQSELDRLDDELDELYAERRVLTERINAALYRAQALAEARELAKLGASTIQIQTGLA